MVLDTLELYTCVCVYVDIYSRVYVCMPVYKYVYVRIRVDTEVYTYEDMWVCTYVYSFGYM